jgi:hypothetical protein
MEMFPADVEAIADSLLLSAIPWFEFPKVDISTYDTTTREFDVILSNEEVNILATYMVVEWMGYQLASIDNIAMKYSGSDFKFTSQANHIAKLQALRDSYKKEGFHLQRLYKRRMKDETTGLHVSAFSQLMEG